MIQCAAASESIGGSELVEKVNKLKDVYGVGRDMPLNYVERDYVDKVFVDSLTRDKHIVIFGSSKQGKTTLRKHCLREEDYIVVTCLNTMTLSDLNGAILKAAGYQIEQSQTKTIGGNFKYGAEFRGEGKVPFLAKAQGGGKLENTNSTDVKTETQRLEIDLNDVNDIILSLKEANFKKFIILEDFHYLPIDTQQNFSFALKSYHENSDFCFVIIGVWREKNRLIFYNGDLSNRLASIDADTWSHECLQQVVEEGEKLLNIQFNEGLIDEIIQNSAESVSLLQEACFKICEANAVYETCSELKIVYSDFPVKSIMESIVNEQSGRYIAFLNSFSEGFQKSEYDMYRWLIYAVLKAGDKDLDGGIRRGHFSTVIKERHKEGRSLNEGNITQALQYTASLQVKKNIRPIILDYDQTSRTMNIVDRSFIIWLSMQDKEELIREIGIV